MSELAPVALAKHWCKNNNPPEGCPVHVAGYDAEHDRPEIYGRFAREMLMIIDSPRVNYYDTGSLGDMRPESIKTDPYASAESNDSRVLATLRDSWQSVLELSCNRVFSVLQTPQSTQDQQTLEVLLQDRADHPELDIQHTSALQRLIDGSETATRRSTELMGYMNTFLRQHNVSSRDEIIRDSHGPIRRLTSSNLVAIEMDFASLVEGEMLEMNAHSKLVFTDEFEEALTDFEDIALQETPELLDPHIGCPIILNPKQLQEFWRWGVDMASETGILEDYMGREVA